MKNGPHFSYAYYLAVSNVVGSVGAWEYLEVAAISQWLSNVPVLFTRVEV